MKLINKILETLETHLGVYVEFIQTEGTIVNFTPIDNLSNYKRSMNMAIDCSANELDYKRELQDVIDSFVETIEVHDGLVKLLFYKSEGIIIVETVKD